MFIQSESDRIAGVARQSDAKARVSELR